MNRKNRSKERAIFFASVLILIVAFALSTAVSAAETDAHSWYIMRTKDHSQPRVEGEMSFISDYETYYIDSTHSGFDDEEKVLYLTFDAGYENGNVERILDTLKEKDVHGAFFILDNMIKRLPDLVLRMKNEGHLVCNHTCKHRDMSKVTDIETFSAELTALSEKYRALTGEDMPKYYRPPEGRFSECNLKHAKELGYKTILWSFAYADWDNDKQPSFDSAIKTVTDNIHNGAVLLLHPTSKTNADILGTLIDRWKAEGYRFGTLDELTCGK